MFGHSRRTGSLPAMATTLELIYHSTVRHVRKKNGNAVLALMTSMTKGIVMLGAFYAMFTLLDIRGAAIRGDFMLYLMSGIFLFLSHNAGLAAVMGAEGPTSPMMKHAPMNTAIAISSAALAALYVQILAMLTLLFIYHVAFTPIYIPNPAGAFAMFVLAWFAGCSIGLVLLALKPWMPGTISLVSTIYQRVNMIASGKMFVANTLPASMVALFDWNPLFHAIDQARGFMFLNYFPRNSSISYPIWFAIAFLMLGLLGEFVTRKNASLSWGARR
ncbi:ABC transporter permease [Poseidonocella pacifica]|nr:ABC transporter permease [Poseidonocella pacifica]